MTIGDFILGKKLEGALNNGDVGLADLGNLLRPEAANQFVEVRLVLVRLRDGSLCLQ